MTLEPDTSELSRTHAASPSTVAGSGRTHSMTLYGIREEQPGPRWQALYDVARDAYHGWYLSEGAAARPDLRTCRRKLANHMPELVPVWERLVELAGGDEVTARLLTLWDPPRFLPGCSQATIGGRAPLLIRNYDYGLDLFERVVYSSAFTGRRVLGMGDCLWGLLDGMNDAGLAVSLAFGGRPGSSPGFGIPLVVRYVLEVAASLDDVRSVLRRIPINMNYNLTFVDGSGESLTAFVAPDSAPEFSSARVATNHRDTVPEDPERANSLRSVERQRLLLSLLASDPDITALTSAFLRPPLLSTEYGRAFGTLYTAVYRPNDGVVDYLWPQDSWRRTFASVDATKTVILRESMTTFEAAEAAGPKINPIVSGSGPGESGADESIAERMAGTAGEPEPTIEALAQQARQAVEALARRSDPAAFSELLRLSALVGECLGVSARSLADGGSWAHVAEVAGVTRQAAWSRWRSEAL
jgi:predicted choloylglycine hydrolase